MAAASSLRNSVLPFLRHRIGMARGAPRMSTTGTGTGAGNAGGGSGPATGGAANSGGTRMSGSGSAATGGGGGADTGASNCGWMGSVSQGAAGTGGGGEGVSGSGGVGAGGGVVANSGGGAGATGGADGDGLAELRKEMFERTGEIWDKYNERAEMDRQLFEKIRQLQVESSTSHADSKAGLLATTYNMAAFAGVFLFGFVVGVFPDMMSSIVEATDKEVQRIHALAGGSPAVAPGGEKKSGLPKQ